MRLLKFRWVTTAASASSRCTILSIFFCVYFISLTTVVHTASSSSKASRGSSSTRNTRTSEFTPSKAFNPIQAAELRKATRQQKRLLLPYVKENITNTGGSKNKAFSSQENTWKVSSSDEWNNVASVKNLQDKLKNTKTVRINDTRYFTPLKKGSSRNTTKKPKSSSGSKKTFSIAKNLTSYAPSKQAKTSPPKVDIKPTHVTHFTYADIRPSAGDFEKKENNVADRTTSYSQTHPVYAKSSSAESKLSTGNFFSPSPKSSSSEDTASKSNYFSPSVKASSAEIYTASNNFFSPSIKTSSAEVYTSKNNFFSPSAKSSSSETKTSSSNSFSPSPEEPQSSGFSSNSFQSIPSVPAPNFNLIYGFTPVPKTSSVSSSSSFSTLPKVSSSVSTSSSFSSSPPVSTSVSSSSSSNYADTPHAYSSSASSSSSNFFAPKPPPTPLSSNNASTWGIPTGTPTYIVPILPTVRKVDNSIHYHPPPPPHHYHHHHNPPHHHHHPPHHHHPFRPPPPFPIRPPFFRPPVPGFKLSGLSAKLNNMFDEGSPRGISSLAKPGVRHKPQFGARPFVQDPIPLDTNEKLSSHSGSFESYNNPASILIIGNNDDHDGPRGVTRIKGNKKSHYQKGSGSHKHSSQEIIHHSHENSHHSQEHTHEHGHHSKESHKHENHEKDNEKQASYERVYGQPTLPKHAYVPAAGLSPGVDPGLHFHGPLGPLSPRPISNAKKKSIPDLVPLDKRVVFLSMVLSWVFWIITFCTYFHWGKKFGSQVPGKPGHFYNKPIIFTVPHDGSTPHFDRRRRSLEGSLAGGRWNFARVLEMIDIAQKTYEGFDWQSMDCQKKILCELSHKNNDLGETGRKISTSISYYTGVSDKFMEALEGFPMPRVIQYYLKEYKDAIVQGKNSNKDCGQVYSTCKFSLKDIFVNKSIKKSA